VARASAGECADSLGAGEGACRGGCSGGCAGEDAKQCLEVGAREGARRMCAGEGARRMVARGGVCRVGAWRMGCLECAA
jgi:hypothetical protein